MTQDARARAGTLDERSWLLVVAGGMAVVLVAVVSLLPMPFGSLRPGPVENVLGEVSGEPMIEITGHQTYPTEGTLDLLTVRVAGGPGSEMTVWDLVAAWVDPDVDVRPERDLFDLGRTAEENRQRNAQEMESSQESATVAALTEVGIDVPATLSVAGHSPGSQAEGLLQDGDVLVQVGMTPVRGMGDVRSELAALAPGAPIPVTVRRDGQVVDVAVPTIPDPQDGTPRLGVYIDPTYQVPFDVKIQIEDVGGPSAGMMFALGIADHLTPGPMTGGKKIAGTGSMSSSGEVGAIGGIRQKMISARAAGAEWFLAPAGNCPEVDGQVPDGLRVVKVATLHEARVAVEAIGSGSPQAEQLPTCS